MNNSNVKDNNQDNHLPSYCKVCSQEVQPLHKVFNTLLCPKCNTIISSDIGIEKAGI